jgi:L-threonylcarbamoyladenylate synthase
MLLFRLHRTAMSSRPIFGNSCAFVTSASKATFSATQQQRMKLVSIDDDAVSRSGDSTASAICTTDIIACGRRLAQGGLVAFPTETVYGLGCDASNADAIRSVFHAKERPLTDPLIVHVLEPIDAYPLWAATSAFTADSVALNETQQRGQVKPNTSVNSQQVEGRILKALCEAFWPGPLTLIAAAAPGAFCTANGTQASLLMRDSVLSLLTAGTGYIAVRSPRHNTARAVLAAAGLPIAAPSANKFGHVSPTRADHVWDDLQYENVWILYDEETKSPSTCCDIGVESTVAKVERCRKTDSVSSLEFFEYKVTILRQGAVSLQDISSCLDKVGLLQDDHSIVLSSCIKQVTSDAAANIAPGQTLRHYSPNVPSFLVSEACVRTQFLNANAEMHQNGPEISFLADTVVLDYAGQLSIWRPLALAYRDLSPTGDSQEAAQGVFEILRWAEHIPGVKRILFPQRLAAFSSDALTLALQDRLTRAASGVVLDRLVEEML